jgi:hypothetical protein
MKKFKTVAGYLRSMGDQLYYKQEKAKLEHRPVISDDEGERDIINNLLPQLGIVGRIGQDEKPRDGVKRLQQAAQGDAQVKALAACLKWLNGSSQRVRFIGATPTSSRVTISGVSYGP